MNNFAKILIVSGVLLALFALGRGLYYAPNDDSGLALVPGGWTELAENTPNTVATTAAPSTLEDKDEPAASFTTTPQRPSRIIIPKLDIDTKVQHVGVTRSGNMAAPNNFTDVSWYKYGTIPGAKGSAVMAGHQTNALGNAAIFYTLPQLALGDEIYVEGPDGKRLRFRVVDEEVYAYNDPKPLERIFHASDDHYLVLITCAGKWLPSAKTNDKRHVVYAKLVR